MSISCAKATNRRRETAIEKSRDGPLTVSLFQFITLAGLHSNAYISNKFAQEFATQGMEAYVRLIQGPEADEGCDVLTHQKWSGAELIDCALNSASNGVRIVEFG